MKQTTRCKELTLRLKTIVTDALTCSQECVRICQSCASQLKGAQVEFNTLQPVLAGNDRQDEPGEERERDVWRAPRQRGHFVVGRAERYREPVAVAPHPLADGKGLRRRRNLLHLGGEGGPDLGDAPEHPPAERKINLSLF